jgi:hypothetical protein
MKKTFIIIVLLTGILMSCDSLKTKQRIEKVNADFALNNIENYSNCKIEIEGNIVHVCGVDGKKMKLRTANGEIIKIVPLDSTLRFDRDYYKKSICVQGIITESKLEMQTIDSLEKEKTLLCHIDRNPCKDKKWVENQIKKGISDSLSKRDIETLKEKMLQTGKNYVSIFTIIAENILIKDEEKTSP